MYVNDLDFMIEVFFFLHHWPHTHISIQDPYQVEMFVNTFWFVFLLLWFVQKFNHPQQKRTILIH